MKVRSLAPRNRGIDRLLAASFNPNAKTIDDSIATAKSNTTTFPVPVQPDLRTSQTGILPHRIILTFTQFFIRAASLALMSLIAKFEVHGRYNAESAEKPLLLISNHKSYIDPLIIAASLPLFSKAYPLYFIGKDELFKNHIVSLTFRLLGTFPVFRGQGMEKSWSIPIDLLVRQEQAVVFFPEGQCIREERLGDGKLGAARLALQIRDLYIVPIAICGSHKLKHFIFRPKVRVAIGVPFTLASRVSPADLDIESVSTLLMEEIARLYRPLTEYDPPAALEI
jgi:1-acyl-sn-glycerol-3-phosphate acyltransferase